MTLVLIKFLLYGFSIILLAYFAGTETALTSLSTLSISNLKKNYPNTAAYVLFWEQKPNEILSTILVGTNLMLVATSVLATSIAIDLSANLAASTTVILWTVPPVSIIITLLCGDIVPKIFSRYRCERVAVFALPGLVNLSKYLSGFNVFLLKISEKILGILGQRSVKEKPFLQPEELKILLTSDETLPLSTPERKMMKNIIDFGKTKINRVMIPRERIQAVNLEQEPEKVIEQIIEKEYSRIPVYRGNLDNIVGIIYSKDLTFAWRNGSLFLIDDLVRPAYFVPGSARVDQVLREFKTGHQHLALVVDEFGSVRGLATIEDLVEVIVGEIFDEYDIKEKTVISMPDNSYLLKASEPLSKVNEELGISLPLQEFATLGGWVLDLFGKIPKIGETVRWDNLEIEIIDSDKKKVTRVKIKKLS